MIFNRPIIIAICLLFSLFLGVLLLRPEYQKLQNQNSIIYQKEQNLLGLKKYFSENALLKEELNKYQDEILKINQALPSEFFLPSLLHYLQKTASENGLILRSFSQPAFTIFKGKEDIKEIHLNLFLAGSYSTLKTFLTTLEKNARLIEIESISLSSSLEEEKPFGFNVGIKVYSY